MKYKFKLKGLTTPPGTISIRALKDLVDTVIESEAGEEIFEKMPAPPRPISLCEIDLHKLSVGPALEEIWGKWPGDGPIEELLGSLTR